MLTTALAACGGGTQTGAGSGANPSRGTLLSSTPELISTVPASLLLLELGAISNQQLLTLGGTPFCDVLSFRIRYATVGGANEYSTASGALMMPTGTDPRCRGARPLLLYAHGTTTDRSLDIANLDDTNNVEGRLIAAVFAAQGYIVVAPNYAGYDTSSLAYHPYLNGDQQSKDMIDALTAARKALAVPYVPGSSDAGRLYISGYSQGGYVAMATHRALAAAGMSVTASAPMSGPYALAAFVDAVFAGRVSLEAPLVTAYLITAYQRSFGGIYSGATEVFEAQYAAGIQTLLPSTTPRSGLYSQGKMPQSALFAATPPSSAFADITPATTPAAFAALYAQGFGANNLIMNSYRLSYLLDAQAHPDGGWPSVSDGLPAASPSLAWRKALKRNDLRDWVPTTPALLCGGSGDPTVFWLNTQLMQGYWNSKGMPPTAYTVLDVDSAPGSGDPYATLKDDFAVAKTAVAVAAIANGATDGGAGEVRLVYHSALVPPFCLAAVRSFFAGH